MVAALTLVSGKLTCELEPSKILNFSSCIGRNRRGSEFQRRVEPYSLIKPIATIKVGGTADWVLVTEDAVWVASTKPFAILRIDPAINRIVASIRIAGEACSGLAFGFDTVWVPICGSNPALVRIDATKNALSATLRIAPAGAEGGIAASEDSIWMVTDQHGTLVRVDPSTNKVRQRILIPPGSFNPVFSGGIIWVTGIESSVLTAVDADSGKVLESIPVGSKLAFSRLVEVRFGR